MVIELAHVLKHIGANENVIEYSIIEESMELIEEILLLDLFRITDGSELIDYIG